MAGDDRQIHRTADGLDLPIRPQPLESEDTMLTNALIVNGLVLFAVLEADLGPARKVSRFRLLRPLLLTGAIVPMFLEAIATHGTGVALDSWFVRRPGGACSRGCGAAFRGPLDVLS